MWCCLDSKWWSLLSRRIKGQELMGLIVDSVKNWPISCTLYKHFRKTITMIFLFFAILKNILITFRISNEIQTRLSNILFFRCQISYNIFTLFKLMSYLPPSLDFWDFFSLKLLQIPILLAWTSYTNLKLFTTWGMDFS